MRRFFLYKNSISLGIWRRIIRKIYNTEKNKNSFEIRLLRAIDFYEVCALKKKKKRCTLTDNGQSAQYYTDHMCLDAEIRAPPR